MPDPERPAQDFAAATAAFVEVVVAIPPDAWQRPALGVWSVRDLVGHTSRALTTVPAYLAAPTDGVDIEDAAGYFMAALRMTTHEQVAERGRISAAGLGPDPLGVVREQARAAVAAVDEGGMDRLVQTPVGGMRLGDYLPTRTFELTVHSADLMAATGLARRLPAAAVTSASRLSVDLAVAQGKALEVLLALNHRQPLDPDFAIL